MRKILIIKKNCYSSIRICEKLIEIKILKNYYDKTITYFLFEFKMMFREKKIHFYVDNF